jgi:phosphoadenosine phosphosulfate reductase
MTDHDLVARIESARILLAEAAHDYGQAVLASAMGAEDMVLLDLIKRDRLPISVFTLDTGRLPEETLDLIARAQARYRVEIEIFTPDAQAVAQFDAEHGSAGIFQSVDTRKACCSLRKVAPLRQALAGKGSWITGLRRSQSLIRADISEKTWDGEHGLTP